MVQELSYDACGRLRNASSLTAYTPGSEPELFLGRGYTGHEHLTPFGLINMNARVYDPALGRFLSPDPYVQAPDMTQNYNRYSYCLNNPLKFVDPDGEFWHIVAGAVIGGAVNLAVNWENIDGFWDGLAAVGVGAGVGASIAATGGAGAGFWTMAGVSTTGGALMSGTNEVIAQTGQNFSGFNNVNWSQVGQSSVVGGVSGFAGGATGYWASNTSFVVNGINSPVLRTAVTAPISSAAGHVAGGTTMNLLAGQSLGEAYTSSFDGIGKSMLIGTGIGVTSTVAVCYANGVNPLNGNSLTKTSAAVATGKLTSKGQNIVGTNYDEVLPTQDWIDPNAVARYKLLLLKGEKLPSISAYKQNGKIYIEDGHHRFVAYKELGMNPNIYIRPSGGPIGYSNWSNTSYQNIP